MRKVVLNHELISGILSELVIIIYIPTLYYAFGKCCFRVGPYEPHLQESAGPL